MKYKEFVDWCNARACDGCWDEETAILCGRTIDFIESVPFWKRKTIWKKLEGKAEIIVSVINIRIKETTDKQIAKKPIHIHEEYEKHEWKKKENGEIDEWACSSDYHNGVMCERCYTSYCVCCDPDYDEKDDYCIVDFDVCPACNSKIDWDWGGNSPKHCKECGQALDWSDSE